MGQGKYNLADVTPVGPPPQAQKGKYSAAGVTPVVKPGLDDEPDQPQESGLSKAWRVANTPVADLAFGKDTTKTALLGHDIDQKIDDEDMANLSAAAHGDKEGVDTGFFGKAGLMRMGRSAERTAESFTSPIGIGLMALGTVAKGGQALNSMGKVGAAAPELNTLARVAPRATAALTPAAKAGGTAAGVGFGANALSEMGGRREGETSADTAERNLSAGSQVAFGAHGVADMAPDVSLPRTKGSMADRTVDGVRRGDVYKYARDNGINMNLAQAGEGKFARNVEAGTENIAGGAGRMADAKAQQADQIAQHVENLKDKFDPYGKGKDVVQQGEMMQHAAETAADVARQNASDKYEALDNMPGGNSKSGVSLMKDELVDRRPIKADAQRLYDKLNAGSVSGVKPTEAMGVLKSIIDGPDFSSFGDAHADRSNLNSAYFTDAVSKGKGEAALGQLSKSFDNAMQTSAKDAEANGMVGAQKAFNDAQSAWRNYKQTFGDKSSPLVKAIDQKEPGKILDTFLNNNGGGSVRAMRQMTEQAPAFKGLLKRELLNRITAGDPSLKMLNSRLGKYSDPFLNELFKPQELNELKMTGQVAKSLNLDVNPSGTAKVGTTATALIPAALEVGHGLATLDPRAAAAGVGMAAGVGAGANASARVLTNQRLTDHLLGYEQPQVASGSNVGVAAKAAAQPQQPPGTARVNPFGGTGKGLSNPARRRAGNSSQAGFATPSAMLDVATGGVASAIKKVGDILKGDDSKPFAKMAKSLAENGGFTYNLATGDQFGKDGFAVSAFPERAETFDKKPSAKVIADYAKRNSDILGSKEADRVHVGGWKGDDGKYYLDLSTTTPDLASARKVAGVANQKAIFDSDKFNQQAGDAITKRGSKYTGEINLGRYYDEDADPLGLRDKAREAAQAKGMHGEIAADTTYYKLIREAGFSGTRDGKDVVVSWDKVPVKEFDPNPKGSSIDLSKNPTKLNDNPSIVDMAKMLEQTTKANLKPLKAGVDADSDVRDRAVSMATAEIDHQLKSEANSGRDWYSKDNKRMEDAMKTLHPELADKNKMSLFKAASTILSLGVDGETTMKNAHDAWGAYNKDGEFPLQNPTTGKGYEGYNSETKAAQFDLLNSLIKEKGEAGAVKFLNEDHPIKELREWNKWVTGPQDKQLPGSWIFGKKAGPFYQNLNGNYDHLTSDLWFTRSWNRWMGTLIDKNGEVQQSPRNATERRLQQESFNEVAKQTGLSVAEAQAVIWYYEQHLYTKHGVDSLSGSYGDAAEKLADKVRPGANAADGAEADQRGAHAIPGEATGGGEQRASEVQSPDHEGEGDESFGFGSNAEDGRAADRSVSIQSADHSDLGELKDWKAAAGAKRGDGDHQSSGYEAARIADAIAKQKHVPRGTEFAVKRDHEGKIIGVAQLDTYEGANRKLPINVDYLATHPDAIGQGVGKQMMQHIINMAADEDRGVTLMSKSSAEGFYESLGFKRKYGLDNGEFYMSPEDVKQIAKQGKPMSPVAGTPEFKDWFGGSKVVDDKGDPLRVFHGTTNTDIKAFGVGDGVAGEGIYFSKGKYVSGYWGKDGAVYPAYLKMEKPFVISPDTKISHDDAIAILDKVIDSAMEHKKSGSDDTVYTDRMSRSQIEKRMVDAMKTHGPVKNAADLWTVADSAVPATVIPGGLKSAGYDGIIHRSANRIGDIETHGKGKDTVYVVFDPKQVSSATGQFERTSNFKVPTRGT